MSWALGILASLWSRRTTLPWGKVALAGILVGAYLHYTGLLRENHELRADLDKTGAALTRLETNVRDFGKALERNAATSRDARAERDRLYDLLDKLDLDAAAREDPDALEHALNERGAGVLRDLRCVTGGPCTDPREASAP